jgi:hypothetical protein
MDPPIRMPGANKTIDDLPVEIRQDIWKLVLTQQDDLPIAIVSPDRRGSTDRLPNRTPHLGALLLVNKAFYAEAGPMFYKSNTFAIGNRTSASQYEPNAQALHAFIKRVPKFDIALITNLCLHVELCGSLWQDHPRNTAYRAKKVDLISISRAIVKHFSAVKNIEYVFLIGCETLEITCHL